MRRPIGKPKDVKVTAMFDRDEHAMLEEMSRVTGQTMSQLLRTMVRERYVLCGVGQKKK